MAENTASPLTQFDFSQIEDLDPSVQGGFQVVYDREVPFELRVQESTDGTQEVGTLEAVKVKILVHVRVLIRLYEFPLCFLWITGACSVLMLQPTARLL